MPTCRACGAQAPDEARFCPTCGSTFGAPPATPVEGPAVLPPVPGAPAPPPPAPWVLPPAARPMGVLLMSLWNLLAGAFAVMLGLGLALAGPSLFADPAVREQVERDLPPDFPVDYATLVDLIAVAGVIVLLEGLLMVAVGYGMYQGRGWAWPGMMVLLVVWALHSLLAGLGGILGLVVVGFLVWYFTRDGVKRWFGRVRAEEPGLPGYVPPPSRPPA